MKTQILMLRILIITIIFCTACSKNDDGDGNSKSIEQLFVGTWKPLKYVDVCSTGIEDIEILTTCEQIGRLTVNKNGTWSETYFYEYLTDVCEDDGKSNGTWDIVNNKLFVIEKGFAETEITFFEIEGDILRLGLYEEDPYYTCDGDNLPSHYYREYIRI